MRTAAPSTVTPAGGVDLSAGMLERAVARSGYDELHCAELTSWLAEVNEQFDLLFAADTLLYFGDLGRILGLATCIAPWWLARIWLKRTPMRWRAVASNWPPLAAFGIVRAHGVALAAKWVRQRTDDGNAVYGLKPVQR